MMFIQKPFLTLLYRGLLAETSLLTLANEQLVMWENISNYLA